MMTSMQQISKAHLVRTGPTPEFVELCKTLYGDVVDPHEVWVDVIKLSPDQADVSASRKGGGLKRTMEGIALASTVAGGVLGVKEGAGAVRAVRAARKAGEKVPGKAYRSLGLAGLATGGDAITTGVLASQNKKSKGQLQPTGVEKVAVRGPKTVPLGLATKPFKQAARADADPYGQAKWAGQARRWKAAGSDVGEMLSTTSGKAVTGTLALTGGVKAKHTLQEQGYAKRDDTADVEFAGTFSKFDDDKRLAFGWASVVKVNGAPVVDRQGDYIDLDDLEEAAYNYVHKSRVGGDMHRRNGEQAHKVSDMVESMMFTDDKIAKMGLPDDFPRGWWVGYKIHDEDTWSEVRKGGRTGFSIHGKGLRKDHALDDIMGY